MAETQASSPTGKHRAEYLLLRALASVVRWMPLRAGLAVGWGLAWVSHRLLRFRVAEAHARIRMVLGADAEERQVRRIAWQAWRNLCFTLVDVLRLPDLTRDQAAHMITNLEALDQIRELRAAGPGGVQGVVLAVPHLGGWDMAGIVCHLYGIPMFFIARRQKNPLVDDLLNRMRGATGVETVLNDSRVLQDVIRRLRAGKVLAILPDVRAPTRSLAVPFLGGEANIGAGMALFAGRAGVPILPAYVVREGWTRHRWTVLDPVYPNPQADRKSDRLRMTREVMARFDAAIRKHPEHYFWYNKRWVLDPLPPAGPDPGEDGKPAGRMVRQAHGTGEAHEDRD
jgi:KDO2-lipid IV(A) lauroyltransferase